MGANVGLGPSLIVVCYQKKGEEVIITNIEDMSIVSAGMGLGPILITFVIQRNVRKGEAKNSLRTEQRNITFA